MMLLDEGMDTGTDLGCSLILIEIFQAVSVVTRIDRAAFRLSARDMLARGVAGITSAGEVGTGDRRIDDLKLR